MKKSIPLFLLLFVSHSILSQAFFPFSFENKWGAVDKEGNIVIEAKYDNIPMPPPNRYNTAGVFQQDGKFGIVNNQGVELITGLEFLSYDGNGAFAWYYEDPSNSKGLHIFGIKEQKEIAFDSEMRVKHEGVLGTKTKFIILKGKDNSQRLLDERGKEIFASSDIYRPIEVSYIENDCPMISYMIIGRKYFYYDCTGQAMSEDEYIEKYGASEDEDYPQFLDMSVGGEKEKGIEDYRAAYPEFELVKMIKSKQGQAQCILAKKEGSYGIVSLSGKLVLDFEYTAISKYDNFLLLRKYALLGAARLDGKLFLPCKYAMINKYSQDHGFIRVLTKSGYWGYANMWGKLYLPKGVDE